MRLTPYRDDAHFAELHAAGRWQVTASMVPSLFDIPLQAWRPRSYAIAAHISGQCPLEEIDGPVLLRGRMLEPVCVEMHRRECPGEDIRGCRAFAEHLDVPLLASPDGLLGDDGIVEYKVISPGVWRERWAADGPPLDVQLQHQAQFACCPWAKRGAPMAPRFAQAQFACCPWAKRGAIGALVVGEHTFEFHAFDTAPIPKVIERIETTVDRFVSRLRQGIWPDPQDAVHDSVARALERMFAPEKGAEILIDGPEARERLEALQQARLDRLAAEKREEANQNWFLCRCGKAEIIRVGNSGEIRRKPYKIKAQAARPATTGVRWGLKDITSEEDEQ